MSESLTESTRTDCLLSELRGYGASRILVDLDPIGRVQLCCHHNARKHGGGPELVITAFHECVDDALVEACKAASVRRWEDGRL